MPVEDVVARRLLRKVRIEKLVQGTPLERRMFVRSSLQGMSESEWSGIVDGAASRTAEKIGRIVIRRVDDEVKRLATEEANSMLTDDSLDRTELERILNGVA